MGQENFRGDGTDRTSNAALAAKVRRRGYLWGIFVGVPFTLVQYHRDYGIRTIPDRPFKFLLYFVLLMSCWLAVGFLFGREQAKKLESKEKGIA